MDIEGSPELLPLVTVEIDAGERVIEVDLNATRNRIRRLRRYVRHNLLDQDDFICSAYAACSSSCRPGDAFREGTMSHVGRRFDLSLDGKPLRIVVVGQESGWPKDPKMAHLARRVSMEDRSSMRVLP